MTQGLGASHMRLVSREAEPAAPTCCVILAAGKGRRLSMLGGDRPKPLMRLLGLSLAERAVASAMAVGVTRFVVVVGHRADEVRAHFEWIASQRGCEIQFAQAEDWERGNGASTQAAATRVASGPFLLLLADRLVTPALLRQVLASPPQPGEVCVAVDREPEALVDRKEAVKVDFADERITRIGKSVRLWSGVDIGVLFCTRDLFEALEEAASDGKFELSDGVGQLVEKGRARIVDITGSRWIDVDTPMAYRVARMRLLGSLAKGGEDGFVSAYLNRRLSRRLSERLATTSVTPNQITVASFLMALAGAGLLAAGQYWIGVCGALMVQLSSIVDGCDGEVARLKHMTSDRGAWLDTVLDRYADLAVLFAVTFAEASAVAGMRPWIGGLLAATGFLLASYVTKEFALRYGRPYPNDIFNRLRRRDLRLFGICCGALVGFAFEAMVVLGALSHICALGIFLRGWRGPYSYRPA